MRHFLRLLIMMIGSSMATAAPSPSIRDDEVSLGAVRVVDDWLQQNGFSRDRALHSTGILIAWMHDAGTLNDHNMGEAAIALVTMLRQGAADLEQMRELCRVAPNCIDYMGRATALSRREILVHLRHRDLEARTALMNMFVSAGLDHTGKGEWRLVQAARALPAK